MASVGQIPPRIPAQVYGAQGPQRVPVSEPIPPKGSGVGMTPEEELRNLAMFQLGLALMDDRPVGEPFFSTNVSPILKGLGDQLMESRRLNISEEQGEKQIGVQERGVAVQEKAEDRQQQQGDEKLDLAKQEVQLQREALLQKGELGRAQTQLDREKMEVLREQNDAELLLKERALRQEWALGQGDQKLKAQQNFLTWKRLQTELKKERAVVDVGALEAAAKVAQTTCGSQGDLLTPGEIDLQCAKQVYENELRRIRPDLYEAGLEKPDMEGDLDRVVQRIQAGRGTLDQAVDAVRRHYGESGVRQLQRRIQELESGTTPKTKASTTTKVSPLNPPVEELPTPTSREEAEEMAENAQFWLKNGIDITDWYKRSRQLMTPKTRLRLQKLIQERKGQ